MRTMTADHAPGAAHGLVVFLIADVRGYTRFTHEHGDAAGARLAARFAELAERAIAAHGGRVLEVRGDEVLACFTSARGALRAAVALQALCATYATDDLPLRAGIGLDAGEPAPLGGGYRGEALNVAARLCALAQPGEVLATESVLHLARRVEGLEYGERGAVELKGLSQPVRVGEIYATAGTDPLEGLGEASPALGAASVAPALPPPRGAFVAREAEMAWLLDALEATEGGQGRVVMLAGEPGVGKTRLAQETLAQATRRGWRPLVGRCYEQQSTLPYFPFAEALAAGVALAPSALRAELAWRWPDLAHLVPEVGSTQPHPEGESTRLRLLRAVTGFITALAGDAPLLLLLDDLHWADCSSLDLLQHLARHLAGTPVLLLGTYRDVEVGRQHPLETALSDLLRERLVEEITVRGLSVEGTAALIAARTGRETISPEFAAKVHNRTEGNPFFTEEVLAALAEEYTAGQQDAGGARRPLQQIEVPRSVRSVVGRRVGRLSAETQDLLHAASVLGQEFDLDVLLASGGQPEAVVLDGLDTALATRLLEERPGRRGERYAFTHTLIQQSLYEEMPAHRRRRQHLRAGEALERARGEQPEAWSMLARHFLAAGATTRAVRYAILAGDHAAELYAAAEAAGHYEMALDLLLEDGDASAAAEVRCKLGNALHVLDRRAEALTAYAQALEIYERLDDAASQARVHRDIAWVHQWRMDLTAAAPHLERALALWPSDREDADLARLLLDAARARHFAGDAAEAAPLAARGLALAERLHDVALQGRALVEVALVRETECASTQDIIALLDRAEALSLRAGDRLTLARIYGNRSAIKQHAGDLAGERADLERRVENAEQSGLPAEVATARRYLANSYFVAGDWAQARDLLRQAGHAHEIPECRLQLALLEGDYAGALVHLRADQTEARRRGDMQSMLGNLITMAYLSSQLGLFDEAEALVREAQGLMPNSTWFQDRAHTVLAEVLARRGSTEAAAALAEANAYVESAGSHIHRPQLMRARALLLCREGDAAGALAALRAGADVARAQGNALELGCTLADLIEMARAHGDADVAAAAEAERAALLARIGPTAHPIPWGGARP